MAERKFPSRWIYRYPKRCRRKIMRLLKRGRIPMPIQQYKRTIGGGPKEMADAKAKYESTGIPHGVIIQFVGPSRTVIYDGGPYIPYAGPSTIKFNRFLRIDGTV